MRRQLWLLITVVAVFSVLVAAPATAKKPVHGDQVMLLNQNLDGSFGAYGCPEISWFGEVEIDGVTYGTSLHPDPTTRFVGKSAIMQYVEDWKIWSEEFSLTVGTIDDCTPGTVLLAGTDHGVANFDSGVFHSNGVATDADAPFEEWMARHVFQAGTIGIVSFDGVTSLGFLGTFRLN
jgi:hypothetical protein